MLYFLLAPVAIYHWILIIAALIPAIILFIKVYRSDRLEKESPALLWSLVTGGILSTLLAMVEETVGQWILDSILPDGGVLYDVIMYFVIVAIAEETSKYIFMRRRTWNSPEFNCTYDGVVYALFTSLGFALWENISYVLNFGFSTALVRAVTAIPGHASFGVFMGVFYGLAKKYEKHGDAAKSKLLCFLGIAAAALMHGTYDFLATQSSEKGSVYFLIFVVALFAAAYFLVNKFSKNDEFI
ncbi:MAG: PrsW family intramembrane metalloprotease [Lachnospiraceae bacterium]|nr:PrsW family intramembrane metalloprotease [Lachnospiraceae bacterium]